MRGLWKLIRDEAATTAVEYAVMLALILMMVIASVAAVGTGNAGMWSNVQTELDAHGF